MMKVRDKKVVEILMFVVPLFLSSFKLLMAWLWAKRGDWISSGLFVVGALIWAMIFCSVLILFFICHRIDELKSLMFRDSKDNEQGREKDDKMKNKNQINMKQDINEPKTVRPNDVS